VLTDMAEYPVRNRECSAQPSAWRAIRLGSTAEVLIRRQQRAQLHTCDVEHCSFEIALLRRRQGKRIRSRRREPGAPCCEVTNTGAVLLEVEPPLARAQMRGRSMAPLKVIVLCATGPGCERPGDTPTGSCGDACGRSARVPGWTSSRPHGQSR